MSPALPPSSRRGAAAALAAGRVARGSRRARQVLAGQPWPGPAAGRSGSAGKLRWRVEHDDRELKDASAWTNSRAAAFKAGTTTSPWSWSLTPSWPCSGWTQSGCAGLTTFQVVRELQLLLACWAGACPLCSSQTPTVHGMAAPPATPT